MIGMFAAQFTAWVEKVRTMQTRHDTFNPPETGTWPMTFHLLGIDTGGTFTDFVHLTEHSLQVHKVLSTPGAPQDAIRQGIRDMGLDAIMGEGLLAIVHGTTVATNATLEGKGVTTAYITNHGLKDVLHIGRQTRAKLYDLVVQNNPIDLPQENCFEVNARLSAKGEVLSEFKTGELTELKARIDQLAPQAIAVNLLFSFINDEHERQLEQLFEDDYFVSRSSFVLPEYREYERGIATWVNAWLGPLIDDYLRSVKQLCAPSSVSIMQSSGVSISADQAARRAVNLLLSGPVGGLQAARTYCDNPRLITFDMGGTSTDVALIDGQIKLTNEGRIGDLPIAIPMADIHTIGAGGGSIVYIDDGGLLQVGPASAGARPGPACYGLGASTPTVTDANLVLNRLQADAFLGGEMALDTAAAVRAFDPLARQLDVSVIEIAAGVIEIANERMIQALHVISVQRGFDPREFTLVCFGGAGGLHFCELAEALEMRHAIVPVNSGVFSALGMLATSPGRDITRTHQKPLNSATDAELTALFQTIEAAGREELAEEGIEDIQIRQSLDLRYLGQTFTLTLPYTDLASAEVDFHESHELRYGHCLSKPVELVNLRVHLEASRVGFTLPDLAGAEPAGSTKHIDLPGVGRVPLMGRSLMNPGTELDGPILITEDHSTTWVKKGWRLVVDEVGNLILHRVSASAEDRS